MEIESRLVPIMREGVNVIKTIFFKILKTRLAEEYPLREASEISRLCGAVINDLFGTPNTEGAFAAFVERERAVIDAEVGRIAANFEEMRIPLTDALRVQVLCDYQEGIDSVAILSRARDLGILLVDRDVPLPKGFLNLVRALGKAFGLLVPPAEAVSDGKGAA